MLGAVLVGIGSLFGQTPPRQAPFRQVTGVVADFGVASNGWFCITVDDAHRHSELIALDSGLHASIASPPELNHGPVRLGLPAGSLGKYRFLISELNGVQGILGMDALWHMAIGCGYVSQLTLWPTGRVSSAQAKGWVLDVSGPARAREIVEIPIERSTDGLPVLSVDAGGRRFHAALCLGYYQTAFHTMRSPMRAGDLSVVLQPNVRVGPLTIPWVEIQSGESAPPVSNDPSVEGSISTFALGAERVLVDFPARRLYVERLAPTERATLLLFPWLRLPISVTPDGINGGGLMNWGTQGEDDLFGAPLVSIAGEEANRLREKLQMLDRPEGRVPEGDNWLPNFLRKLRGSFVVQYRKSGQVKTFTIPAPGQSASSGGNR